VLAIFLMLVAYLSRRDSLIVLSGVPAARRRGLCALADFVAERPVRHGRSWPWVSRWRTDLLVTPAERRACGLDPVASAIEGAIGRMRSILRRALR
jgi:hypothetical protein